MLICAACVLFPKHGSADKYEEISQIVSTPLGVWGYRLFGASLFIACFGAALEISLDIAYVYSQAFGWNWGEDLSPRDDARFSLMYTVTLLLATLLVLVGLDPLKLTLFSMALTALILPLVVFPFIVLMNDRKFIKDHPNGRLSNSVVFVIIVLAALIALAAIPLEIFGGS